MAIASGLIPDPLMQFSRRGKLPADLTEGQLAAMITSSAIKLSQHSVGEAVRWSQRLVSHTTKAMPRLVSLAIWRAAGRSALMASRYHEAADAYAHARLLCNGDELARGQIDRTLIDVYMYLGKFDLSKKSAERARKLFAARNDLAELAKTKVNYANLLHRQDRHREAEKLYAEAATYFLSISDQLSAARCQYNQANTLVQLFSFSPARELYQSAATVYRDAGYTLDALDADWGLAWLHLLEGEYHRALRELHACEEGYRTFGRTLRVVTCLLDRSEIALTLQLHHDARAAAIEAERMGRRLRLGYETGKAALFRADAAFALGRKKEAAAAIGRARLIFEKENNHGFLGVSELLAAQGASTSAHKVRLIKSAMKRFSTAQLPLWQAIADLQAATEPTLARSALSRLKKNKATAVSPHLYAGLKTIEGDAAWREGKKERALTLWRSAAARLDQVRLQLPPIGQAGSERSMTEAHSRLVDMLADHDPAEALGWSERRKTAGMWQPLNLHEGDQPARKGVSDSLSQLAAQVSMLQSQLSASGERAFRTSASGSTLIAKLQRQVRSRMLAAEKTERNSLESTELLFDTYAKASRRHPVIHMHASANDLIVFRIVDGSTSSHRIVGGRSKGRRLISQLAFLLEKQASGSATHADHVTENQFFASAADWLWRPLEIEQKWPQLLLLIEGELSHFPWHALQYEQAPLIARHQFVLAPSIRHWNHAMSVQPPADGLCLFRGSGDDLPFVQTEAESIQASFGSVQQVSTPCRRVDLATAPSAAYWHYAGHAELNKKNPFYTSLPLADGPYFAADFRLRQLPVGLVTLAACQSGVDPALPGSETSGFVRSLLEMGAKQVLAGNWHVSDQSTAAWMHQFYACIQSGLSPVEAQQQAALKTRHTNPSVYHWGSFSLFGASI